MPFIADTFNIEPPKPAHNPDGATRLAEAANTIFNTFAWVETPEGQAFWQQVHEALHRIARELT